MGAELPIVDLRSELVTAESISTIRLLSLWPHPRFPAAQFPTQRRKSTLRLGDGFCLARNFALAAATLLMIASTQAQMPVSTSTTSTPVPGAGHDYLGEIGETVNPANGSVSIRLSPTMPPSRGFTIPDGRLNPRSRHGGSLK